MGDSIPMTTRPLRIMVDVDDLPRERWPLDGRAVIVLRGRIYSVEPHGCIRCTEMEGNDHVTLCHVDERGAESFICLTHGELTPVEFYLEKNFLIRIGTVTREGQESLTDSMLFPRAMTIVARTELIETLLDDAERQEHEDGPAPSD